MFSHRAASQAAVYFSVSERPHYFVTSSNACPLQESLTLTHQNPRRALTAAAETIPWRPSCSHHMELFKSQRSLGKIMSSMTTSQITSIQKCSEHDSWSSITGDIRHLPFCYRLQPLISPPRAHWPFRTTQVISSGELLVNKRQYEPKLNLTSDARLAVQGRFRQGQYPAWLACLSVCTSTLSAHRKVRSKC